MPFGKYKGWFVGDLPSDYLEWLLTIELRPWLREAVEAEIEHRQDHDAPQPNGAIVDLPTVVRQWHREMALKYHPDREGSHKEMLVVQVCHDRLKELLKLAG